MAAKERVVQVMAIYGNKRIEKGINSRADKIEMCPYLSGYQMASSYFKATGARRGVVRLVLVADGWDNNVIEQTGE